MSADYWNSTQRLYWQFNRETLGEKRKNLEMLENDLIASGALPIHLKDIEYNYYMRIYLHNLVHKLGRRLGLRSVPIATAEVYMLRFLLNVSLKEINIYLLVSTCIYLASKVEECPQHIRTISNEARNLWPEYIPHDLTKIAEFEFYLIEEMDNYMIIHNPYRALSQIKGILAMTNFGMLDKSALQQLDSSASMYADYNSFENEATRQQRQVDGVNCLILSQDELQLCWSIINDSYVTDLSLLFPPHIIAITAIYITVILKSSNAANDTASSFLLRRAGAEMSKNQTSRSETEARINILTGFMGVSNIDLNEVIEAVQEIITLYEIWDLYDESHIRKKVQKLFINR